MSKKVPPPPCTVTKYADDGSVLSTEVITRDPVRISEREPEAMAVRLRVMCLQETGEEQFVGHAADLPHAHALERGWRIDHPEHHSFWTERI